MSTSDSRGSFFTNTYGAPLAQRMLEGVALKVGEPQVAEGSLISRDRLREIAAMCQ